MFFFEKKNQKTFTHLRSGKTGAIRGSLFASFSSEKEDSSFLQGTSE
jgi:hypothetical protein